MGGGGVVEGGNTSVTDKILVVHSYAGFDLDAFGGGGGRGRRCGEGGGGRRERWKRGEDGEWWGRAGVGVGGWERKEEALLTRFLRRLQHSEFHKDFCKYCVGCNAPRYADH